MRLDENWGWPKLDGAEEGEGRLEGQVGISEGRQIWYKSQLSHMRAGSQPHHL